MSIWVVTVGAFGVVIVTVAVPPSGPAHMTSPMGDFLVVKDWLPWFCSAR